MGWQGATAGTEFGTGERRKGPGERRQEKGARRSCPHETFTHNSEEQSYTHSHTHTFTHIKYHPWRVISIPRAVFISVFISCFLHKRHSPTHKRNSINVSFTSSQDPLSGNVYVCVMSMAAISMFAHVFSCWHSSALKSYSYIAKASDIGQRTADIWHRTLTEWKIKWEIAPL